MRVLACFLLCSMLGGASEVLFLAFKDSIRGRPGRASRKLPEVSASTQARVPFGSNGVPDNMERNDGRLESEQA